MVLLTEPEALVGEATPSPAGAIDGALDGLGLPPMVELPKAISLLRFSQRQIEFVFKAHRKFGDTFRMQGTDEDVVLISHPDHVRSLFTAKPEMAPSLAGESPLRPIVGPNSVLTAVGPRHMRQRKLLLPPFHGDAIAQYTQMIVDAAEREIESWPVGEPFPIAPRMQAITLDVIMAGIFGIQGKPEPGTPEHALRRAVRGVTRFSSMPVAQVGELANIGSNEPRAMMKVLLGFLDRPTYAVIAARRAAADLEGRHDILSLLLQARTEDGEAMTDHELRDELITLVLAGHETTANTLAWAWERLVRTPDALADLVSAVRSGDEEESDAAIEAVIVEAMRARPVIPITGRRVMAPWRMGDYELAAETPVLISILLLHHREDLYPDPFAFRPDRWRDRKPGTYEWLPFGGGIRRCLGAALAMAEMRAVLREIALRLDLEADRPEPEHALHRNVTMIPSRGGQVVVTRRAAA
jgi:cytochrome P450